MTARTLLLGDWSPWVRDPIDVLRLTFPLGAAGYLAAGDAHGATVLAVAAFVAALLDAEYGMIALIPFGLFLAFSIDTDEMTSRRSVILTRRNLVLAAAMVAAFGCFWLWREHLGESMLVAIAA